MDSARSNKVKLRISNENVSPLKIEMNDYQRGRYLQRYAENIDTGGSPMTRYFFAGSPIFGKVSPGGDTFTSPTFGTSKYSRSTKSSGNNSSGNSSFGFRPRFSQSPLSAVKNLEIAPMPAMYGTPVKVDEEVLVMDDIQVRRSSSSSSSRGLSSSTSSWSPPFVKSVTNTESGNCRCNSKLQINILQVAGGRGEIHQTRPSQSRDVSQGRGQLHPTSPSMMLKPELSKSPTSAGSSIHGRFSRLFTDVVIPSKLPSGDWSPLDDDEIEIFLPNGSDKAPTREEVHAYIWSTLNQPTTKKRLPVFEALCKEQEELDFLNHHTWLPPSPEQYSKKSVRGY
ncbi:PREDICTED: uncharacterized protein LOC109350588 isoform X2 [Lupinus angustifolius]|nr:PREDICTED: uncharacterized protein LOC109350588 isoform X2 [Lupinus angustifolius]